MLRRQLPYNGTKLAQEIGIFKFLGLFNVFLTLRVLLFDENAAGEVADDDYVDFRGGEAFEGEGASGADGAVSGKSEAVEAVDACAGVAGGGGDGEDAGGGAPCVPAVVVGAGGGEAAGVGGEAEVVHDEALSGGLHEFDASGALGVDGA